ncbi:unnamed protein product [Gongylonema pulchrum]|uniref:Reverse transcriptase domain-containing protein n=1 Tax=Gongylonema pulchrum TaxID=637853 RepID=A0A183DTU3_9BILA|nr:unnamed protein product [Gongylonema pulchrum]
MRWHLLSSKIFNTKAIFGPKCLKKLEDLLNEHERQYNYNNTIWLTYNGDQQSMFNRTIETDSLIEAFELPPLVPYEDELRAIAAPSTEEAAVAAASKAETSGSKIESIA